MERVHTVHVVLVHLVVHDGVHEAAGVLLHALEHRHGKLRDGLNTATHASSDGLHRRSM